MRSSTADNAARVIVCVAVVTTALATTASDPDRTKSERSGERVPSAPAARTAAMMRLHPAVHPAADPLLQVMWNASWNLIMPVAGVRPGDLVDTFAQIRGPERRHEAIDIPAPRGTPVVAVTDGEILRLAEHDSGGITLYQLAPDRRTMFYYAHLLKYAEGVRPGLRVRQGDVIGYVGDTGNPVPGHYHLHFEVMTAPDPRQHHAARPRNPYPLLLRARG